MTKSQHLQTKPESFPQDTAAIGAIYDEEAEEVGEDVL